MKVVLATGNPGKVKEFQEILKDWELLPVTDWDPNFEVDEGETSYVENAV